MAEAAGNEGVTRKWRPFSWADKFAFWEQMAIFAFLLGLFFILIYSVAPRWEPRTFSVLSLCSCAAWLSGSVLGFLFGVPRFQTDTVRNDGRILPNTNLTQISDWLTKIIIGATLVQLGQLTDSLGALFVSIGTQIRAEGASVVVGAVMVFFFATGFMWGYIWCSLRIYREMAALVDEEAVRGMANKT